MPTEEYAKKHFAIEKDKIPKTKFISSPESVKVEMLDWPDPERLKKVFVNFSEGSWFEDFYKTATPDDVNRVTQELLDGVTLAQGLEHPKFAFLVSGLTLNDSHAVVRNRLGICYIQQSGAVLPQTDCDILVPRAFAKKPELLSRYKQWVYKGKQLYQDMLESGEIAITDARMCLPRTVPVWINISVNLVTLLGIYKKRSDSQEEYPALNEMVKQMRDLVCEKFPYMKGYFVSACDLGLCLHNKVGYKANCIFKRDEKHKLKKGQKDNWTLHDKTKFELMLDCKPYETEYYIGSHKVTKDEYEKGNI